MKGFITTIQRMSIHDGPGIRSTVFMKGCNLRCKWCHNPETWSAMRQLQYISSKCIQCGSCISSCLMNSLSVSEQKIVIDRNSCSLCGTCVDNCVSGAMSWIGKEIEAAEVADSLMQDVIYYKESGGGITLSGGEPLLQKAFSAEILYICRENKIHTVVESNIAENWKVIESFLPLVDLWICDLKLANSQFHKKWTGQTNEQIIENLHLFSEHHIPVIIRTPVIPGVNDTEQAIEEICQIIKDLSNVISYELLGFHTLGFEKFRNLGMKNPLQKLSFLNKNRLTMLQSIPEKYGITKQGLLNKC